MSIRINGREVKLFTTTEFFCVPGVEEEARELFDGVQLNKAGEWSLEKIEQYREKRGKEVIFHSGHGIGLPIWDERGLIFPHSERLFAEIKYVREVGIKHYSLALGFTCTQVEKTIYGFNVPRREARLYQWSEFALQVVKNIIYLQRELPNVSLALENLDYHLGGAYECCTAEKVASLIEELEGRAEFLLDFGHAEVSADKLTDYREWREVDYNFECEDILELKTSKYLSRLPLHRITEVHLHRSSISPVTGEVYDAHNPPTRFEVRWLEKMSNLKRIILEYPHNIKALMWRAVDLLNFCFINNSLEEGPP